MTDASGSLAPWILLGVGTCALLVLNLGLGPQWYKTTKSVASAVANETTTPAPNGGTSAVQAASAGGTQSGGAATGVSGSKRTEVSPAVIAPSDAAAAKGQPKDAAEASDVDPPTPKAKGVALTGVTPSKAEASPVATAPSAPVVAVKPKTVLPVGVNAAEATQPPEPEKLPAAKAAPKKRPTTIPDDAKAPVAVAAIPPKPRQPKAALEESNPKESAAPRSDVILEVRFKYASAAPPQDARRTFTALHKQWQRCGEPVVLVTCHTDHDGAHYLNKKLAQRRCLTLRHLLLRRGIPDRSVKTTAFGEREVKDSAGVVRSADRVGRISWATPCSSR